MTKKQADLKRWQAENPDKVRAYSRVWANNNTEKRAAWRNANLEWHNLTNNVLRRYGLTLDQFHAMQERQDFCCAICREFVKLFVDHCHDTNRVRGLLCSGCNAGIGCFKESVENMVGAIAYLQENT